jgi:hypothetical protein
VHFSARLPLFNRSTNLYPLQLLNCEFGERMTPGWIAATFASIVLVASAAQAQSPDPRAKEAVQLFGAFCVATGGTPDRALAVLGEGNLMATRLPDNVVRSAQGGQEGGLGWAVRSPNDGALMLDYTAAGVCGVRISEAEETSVREAFNEFVAAVAAGSNAAVTSAPPEDRMVGNVRTTYAARSLLINGQTAHLALTTAERPVGENQHFMTFRLME